MTRPRLHVALAAVMLAIFTAKAFSEEQPAPAEVVARPFDLADVRLLPGPFHDAMERDRAYLHSLESDRLLWYFRETAGLDTPGEPMGGWEQTEVRGHTMGHYLSACALMYASTGDEKLKAKAQAIVAELAKCQKALKTGYLSAFPEEQIDRAIACKPVWAPWYTLHKIFAGLEDMYVHCGDRQALEVAKGMAAWTKSRLDKLDRAAVQRMLERTEQGGMCETLANLSALTGDPQWLALAKRFNEDHYTVPLAAHRDELTGEHVNSFVPNVIGLARQYELSGDQADRRMAEFFWQIVVHGRSYATGGTSNFEHWRTPPYQLAAELSPNAQESCCTYNMLKLTRHLFTWTADARYADYYERNLYNSILATQDPKTGMCMYFVSMAPGHWKVFHTPRDSFWCCTGTGLENHAKYGDSIYFHDADTLWVNLFIASELEWKEKGVTVRQETRFPETSATTLTVSAARPAEFEMRFRVPGWARRGVTVAINGQPQAVTAAPGSFLSIHRTWKDGDSVAMTMPMDLWLSPMPDDPGLAAIMFGPLVLAGELGGKGLTPDKVYLERQTSQSDAPNAEAPVLVLSGDAPVADWVRPVEGKPLTFRTVGVGRPDDVTLVPYHRLFGQRYSVYWRITDEAGWEKIQAERKAAAEAAAREAARKAAIETRVVDRVQVGVGESERAHALAMDRSDSGAHTGRRWRHARAGGWFEYRLKLPAGGPASLIVTYWGSDDGRTFDILVDGRKLATQTLDKGHPDEYFDVEYPLPADRTKGKDSIVVRFSGQAGSYAGGIFGLAALKVE